MNTTDFLGEFFQEDPHLQAGQPSAEAEVRTAASKGHMGVGVSAQVQSEWVSEGAFVVVGRYVPGDDLVASGYGYPSQVRIGDSGPPEMDLWAGPPKDLLGCQVKQLWVFL